MEPINDPRVPGVFFTGSEDDRYGKKVQIIRYREDHPNLGEILARIPLGNNSIDKIVNLFVEQRKEILHKRLNCPWCVDTCYPDEDECWGQPGAYFFHIETMTSSIGYKNHKMAPHHCPIMGIIIEDENALQKEWHLNYLSH